METFVAKCIHLFPFIHTLCANKCGFNSRHEFKYTNTSDPKHGGKGKPYTKKYIYLVTTQTTLSQRIINLISINAKWQEKTHEILSIQAHNFYIHLLSA